MSEESEAQDERSMKVASSMDSPLRLFPLTLTISSPMRNRPSLSTKPSGSMWAIMYPEVPFCGFRFLLMTMPSSELVLSFFSLNILKRLLARLAAAAAAVEFWCSVSRGI